MKGPIYFDWEHFRCKKCGKCCSEIGLPYPAHRLCEIAKFLNVTPEEFIEKYIGKIIEEDGEKRVQISLDKVKPCPFLLPDNLCSIYEVRPDGCRLYPIETDCGREGVDCKGCD